MVRVLFVCLGNICRSPTAHGVFEGLVQAQGLAHQIAVESAGTGGWHVGNPPDHRAIDVAQRRGVDISHLRASQVTSEHFSRFDYILAMDHQNLSDLRRLQPEDFGGHLSLFLEFEHSSEEEVPDPYYGGEEGFQHAIALIESAAQGLLTHICEANLVKDAAK